MAGSSTERYRLIGYFPAWGIHAQNFQVADIPAALLTHVIYAFSNVTPSAECVSTNAHDDEVNFPRLNVLKQQHPELLTLISIGGASHSTNFSKVAASASLRHQFAQSSVQFMKKNGFDGIDIDWEFPSADDSPNFTELLTALRSALTAQGAIDRRPYLLTVATSAGSSNYSHIQLDRIHPIIDWINLMSYDFTVADSKLTDFVAPLEPYDTSIISAHSTRNVDAAVKAYLSKTVPNDKLVLGTRFVGTGWRGVPSTNDGLYQVPAGPAKGTWDSDGHLTGSFDYYDIETNYVGKFVRSWHPGAKVPWLYGSAEGVMISYEDPESLKLKADYIRAHSLGGAMVWELASDDSYHTLINTLAKELRGPLTARLP
jgi:chitinase